MEPTMEILNLVYALVKKENPDLYHYMMKYTSHSKTDIIVEILLLIILVSCFYFRSELGTIFCLPWTITWFGHVLNDYETVVRLFDVFITSHPWTSMYLSAVVVLHRASEIFSTPCEMPLLHQMLSNVSFIMCRLFQTNIYINLSCFRSLIIYHLIALLLKQKSWWKLIHQIQWKKLSDRCMLKSISTYFYLSHLNLPTNFWKSICSILKIKEEDEERKRRIEHRKAVLQGRNNRAVVRWNRPWPVFRNIRSQTVKVVALSVSVATVAFIYNYVRPNLEIFWIRQQNKKFKFTRKENMFITLIWYLFCSSPFHQRAFLCWIFCLQCD